ncbi:MAG: dihydrofolate reductase family protein, partial [Actinomycetota bacterium]
HEAVFPEMATAFSRLRRTLGLPGSPQLVVLSRSGDLDPSIRALEAGALVITTDAGKANLKGKLPAAATILSRGPEVRIGEVVEVLRRQGGRLILSEGGPHVLGQLLEARVVDELFLTVAPTLTGRCFSRRRLGLIEGFALDLQELAGTDLLSVKRDTSHLFLRYRIRCFSSA